MPHHRSRPPRARRPRRRPGERATGPGPLLALVVAVAAALGWLALPVSALTVLVPRPDRPAAQPGLPWLSTAGDRIVDEQGRTVLLRGLNDDALQEPDSVGPAPLDEVDAADMQRSGFDSVRLPIVWSRLEPVRGTIDTGYLGRIAAAVDLLNRHGMYVILDMHMIDWGPGFGGTGAPRWAAVPLFPDLHWWPWESWRKHLSPAVNAAITYFWIAPDWQSDFQMAWRAVAERFRGDSGVAGYDILNEPHPWPIPPAVFAKDWMWPLYARTIASLGAVDPNHLFIVEGELFGDFGTPIVPLAARNLVYSPHIYTGSLVPPAFDGDPGPVRRHVAEQTAEAREVPAPMWTGELGIDHTQPMASQWADTLLDAYDDNGTGWSWWQWRETGGWGFRDAAGTLMDMPFLRHVARPYLVAAPAGVRGGRGDGVHGRLEVTVAAGHGSGDAVVGWPVFTLGAAPVAAGACLAGSDWDPAGARLTLRVLPGASCTVSITAAPG